MAKTNTRTKWSPQEEQVVIDMMRLYENEGIEFDQIFQAASEKLEGKTMIACKARWYGHLRKKKAEIKEQPSILSSSFEAGTADIVESLTSFTAAIIRMKEEKEEALKQQDQLQKEKVELAKKVSSLRGKIGELEETHLSFLRIIEKARKAVVEEEVSQAFKMERNGNLELSQAFKMERNGNLELVGQ